MTEYLSEPDEIRITVSCNVFDQANRISRICKLLHKGQPHQMERGRDVKAHRKQWHA